MPYDLPDKDRDEDLTERRRTSRRFMNALQGRRKNDKGLHRGSCRMHYHEQVCTCGQFGETTQQLFDRIKIDKGTNL